MEQYKDEIWKPIPNYEGLYKISNNGRVYSYPRKATKGGYSYGNETGKYLSFSPCKNGKSLTKGVHQWVWITFIGQIPEGYDVHHINHNSTDNRLENLELIEKHKHHKMHIEEQEKQILQFTRKGEFVAEYPSIEEAARNTGIASQDISGCINKRKHRKTAGNFIWITYKEYVSKELEIIDIIKNIKPEKKIKEPNIPKKIIQFTLDGYFVKEWNLKDVESKLHIQHSNIIACCKGRRKNAGGYIWKYKE